MPFIRKRKFIRACLKKPRYNVFTLITYQSLIVPVRSEESITEKISQVFSDISQNNFEKITSEM